MKYVSLGFLGGLLGLITAFALGVFIAYLAGCVLPGYVDVSPMEGQAMERRQCNAKSDAEERRRCHALLDRKWGQYNGEGGYPNPSPGRSCGGSADCRGQ